MTNNVEESAEQFSDAPSAESTPEPSPESQPMASADPAPKASGIKVEIIDSQSTVDSEQETAQPPKVETIQPPRMEVVVASETPEAAPVDNAVDEPPVEAIEKPTIPAASQPESSPVEDDSSSSVSAFAEMSLSRDVLRAIEKAGYSTPSPIQEQTVPAIVAGRDLIGQAETGSGKTAAFAWPVLSKLNVKKSKRPQCLVLAPTRELAVQVTRSFEKYATFIEGFRAITIYGGQSYDSQFRALKRGVHVVVGTPGRVIDHLNRGTLDLSELKVFVLDEADEMLRMGFIDDIEAILQNTPEQKQNLFFSATMPAPIRRIADSYLTDPEHVRVQSQSATAESIDQSCILIEPRQKLVRLARLLETEETEGVLIFVKTRNATNLVAESLVQKGVIALPLNGDIPQAQRERTVAQLANGKINVVVATDVAARGLDVQRISHVINYDFPHDTEAYVHRIGRTGRAGRDGAAILFVEPKEKRKLYRLQRETNQEIKPFQQKSLGEINRLRIDKFKQRILDAQQHEDFGFFKKLALELQEEQELSLDAIAGCLGVLAQGDQSLRLKELKFPENNWRKKREKSKGRPTGPMQTFRVEVGKADGVAPRNLVGAITNEAGLTNADIGHIKLFDRFSTVDLPADLPPDLVEHLAAVYVNGKQLKLSKSDAAIPREFRGKRKGPGGRSNHRTGRKRSGGAGYFKSKSRGDHRGKGRKPESREGSDRPRPDRTGASGGKSRSSKSNADSSSRKPKSGKSNNVKKYIKIRSSKKK